MKISALTPVHIDFIAIKFIAKVAVAIATSTVGWATFSPAAYALTQDSALQQQLTKYAQECSACHVAYPAGMLPAASWQRVMGGLKKHYGTDASLDEATVRDISAWLKPNAGTYRRVSEEPPNDRITQSAWFLRKHREGEVPANVWKRASVGSPSNCVACHSNAAKGNFNEHDVRIPK